MKKYRLNKSTATNPKGNNEVHNESCYHYSRINNYVDLGFHANCRSAVADAKNRGYSKADGCAICCPECHTG